MILHVTYLGRKFVYLDICLQFTVKKYLVKSKYSFKQEQLTSKGLF